MYRIRNHDSFYLELQPCLLVYMLPIVVDSVVGVPTEVFAMVHSDGIWQVGIDDIFPAEWQVDPDRDSVELG